MWQLKNIANNTYLGTLVFCIDMTMYLIITNRLVGSHVESNTYP